jgi:hypothetical protein
VQQQPLDISQHVTKLHEAIAEIAAGIQVRAASMDEHDQAMVSMMMTGASIRLAEMRSMLVVAAGGGMFVPPVLKPLSTAIETAIDDVTNIVLAGFPSDSPEDCVVKLENVSGALDAARVAGMNLLGHLGSAIKRIEREPAPTPGPRLAAVDGQVVATESTSG